jgi:hypothetical protein
VVLVLRAKTNAGSVVQPEPSPLLLLLGHFQALLSPDALESLSIDDNAAFSHQLEDPGNPVAAVGHGQLRDQSPQGLLIGPNSLLIALGRAGLPKHPAGVPL